MKQVCKNEKTTKNFCKFVKFLHGTMRDPLLRLFRTFQTKEFASHWLSEIVWFPTANEIPNLHFEGRQERVPHRPMQKLNKFTKVFRIFLVLQTCFKS